MHAFEYSIRAIGTDEKHRGPSLMTRKRVLVADDLEQVRNTVSALLRSSFDVVETVSDGPAALEMAHKHQPDLLVLDITMPGMSGIEVARELRKAGNMVPIVFLTV